MRSSRNEQWENLLVKILIILRRKIKRKRNQWHFTENAMMIQVLRDRPQRWNARCMYKCGRNLKEYENRQKARRIENYKTVTEGKERDGQGWGKTTVSLEGVLLKMVDNVSTQHIREEENWFSNWKSRIKVWNTWNNKWHWSPLYKNLSSDKWPYRLLKVLTKDSCRISISNIQ